MAKWLEVNACLMLDSIDKNWIREHCFTAKGGFNNRVCLESWWINKGYGLGWRKTQDSLSEELYDIYHGLNEKPVCKTCAGKVNFQQFASGYREYCSNSCVTNNKDRNRKISEHPSGHRRMEQTCIERYGGVGYGIAKVQDNAQRRKFEKYGTLAVSIEKTQKTQQEKYGFVCNYKDPKFQKRCQERKLEIYGQHFPPKEPKIDSRGEREVRAFLEEITGYCWAANYGILPRGLELDGVCEELKMSFEYCGLYWHDEFQKHAHYHLDKMNHAFEAGYRLFTIFEDEWEHRQEQVKAFLAASVGKFDVRVAARKCTVREIDLIQENVRGFFEANHIQGASNNIKRAFGLFYQEDLVGCVSFSLHHRKNDGTVTLSRLAFKNGWQVIGGASKLVKYALSKFDCPIVTWSDNRWTSGMLYRKLGFRMENNLGPDYSYHKNSAKRWSKQQFKKSNLLGVGNMTEREYCRDILKLRRIYDCGKRRWVYYK